MATGSVSNTGQTSSVFDQLANSLNAGSETQSAKKKNELGKDAFIQMLVEQLKHQDPTEPIKNEELAVNLAQFSQVEQLVEINKKLGANGISDTASLAAFLGREVLVDGNGIQVKDGMAGSMFVELSTATQSTTVEVRDAGGKVVAQKELGALNSGRQILNLSELGIQDGRYAVNVKAVTLNGEQFSPSVSTGGVVTGFIPGADPSLLIGDKEVKASDIRLVNSPRGA